MLAWKEGPACVVIDPGFYSPEEEHKFFAFIEENGSSPKPCFSPMRISTISSA